MPTYEYECTNCKATQEVTQPITAKPLKKCPKCKKNKLQRIVSCGKTGLVFVGKGFYCNDYAGK